MYGNDVCPAVEASGHPPTARGPTIVRSTIAYVAVREMSEGGDDGGAYRGKKRQPAAAVTTTATEPGPATICTMTRPTAMPVARGDWPSECGDAARVWSLDDAAFLLVLLLSDGNVKFTEPPVKHHNVSGLLVKGK
ncbi:hypothetical protein GGTG_06897 [Gaeumannomyces tritici R3-111a-1]|uniref:Uncharacterized protein n=1 Tax=Gaeumannomyces tritici (strain R3-111a-1) TaxID=644352 RepID=J3P050_GAET3|nr:hypothetical protein GGTG_06897 [Gaeumannomyces tritici R3-111a-1]EJT76983.1 hypothetical protein GGTG_06897 [Gaeumannomyces tritici R3-111a-1]